MANVLEVEDLAIRFGSAVVFRGLSFAVPTGSTLAVIGPSGSGKTVLFRALVGSLPYQGTVRWVPGVRIGYVPQKLDIDRDLPITGRDVLRAKAEVTQGAGDIADAIAAVGLGDEPTRPVGALSGGQFQRLLVATALVGHPRSSSPPSGCASCTAVRSATTSMIDAGTLIASLAMAVAAGMVGCFAVMRRMALASDSISHVALPGIGVALALGIHPLFGAAAMLMFGVLAIWAVERRTRIATETIIGVVFSVAIASTVLGTGIALAGGRPRGPVIVCVAAALFLASLVKRRA